MTIDEIALFKNQLTGCSHYLEFGSGNSTSLAVRFPNVQTITVVESDKNFWDALVISNILLSKAVLEKRLLLNLVDIGPVYQWGFPADESNKGNWPEYAATPFKSRSDYDLVLIDGRFRISCALQTCLNLPAQSKIIIHDFYNRNYYRIVLLFLKEVERVDTMGLFSIKHNIDKRLVKEIFDLYQYSPDC